MVLVQVETHECMLEENGVRLALTVVDTPGYGDAVDNTWVGWTWIILVIVIFQGLLGSNLGLHRAAVWRLPGGGDQGAEGGGRQHHHHHLHRPSYHHFHHDHHSPGPRYLGPRLPLLHRTNRTRPETAWHWLHAKDPQQGETKQWIGLSQLARPIMEKGHHSNHYSWS